MADSQKRLSYDDYTVAIICPLEVEMTAMRCMLDEWHVRLPRAGGDRNRYILGKMGEHNVAIGYLPQGAQGVGAAATVATDMRRTFPQVQLRLLVGIGGGIPSSKYNVRLGDVVVGMPDGVHGGVVQYDLGKRTVDGFERKGFLCPPPDEWRTAVVEMMSDHQLKSNRVNDFLSQMLTKYPLLQKYARPSTAADVLFPPESKHVRNEPTCDRCDKSQAITSQTTTGPKIFYGTIASGNSVIKDADERDALSEASAGVLCFEMEAAGLTNAFPCVVIRGICDYADSHKNDEWHPYAAAVAAACAKDLLSYMDPVPALPMQPIFPIHTTVTRSVNTLFTGRKDVLDELKSVILAAVKDRGRQGLCHNVITGMGGHGKSEICLQLAHQLRSLFWGIFWVDVSTTTLAENGFLDIASRLGVTVSRWEGARQELANVPQPWLLVLDNADDPYVDYQQYFPASTFGVVLLTSRNDKCEQYATKCINLERLALADAKDLLLRACGILETRRASLEVDAQAVAHLLQSHPLALIQAASYVSQGHCSLQEYPQLYERQRKRLLAFRPVQAASRYRDIYATFEASAETLGQSDTLAASDALELLPLLSVYGSSRLPMLLFKAAWHGVRLISVDEVASDNLVSFTPWHLARVPSFFQVEAETWDSFRLVEALNLLRDFSLITIDGEASSLSVSMHPLVHAWARDRLSTERQHECWVQAGCVVALSRRQEIILLNARQLRPHIQAVTSWSASIMFSSDSIIEVCRIALNCGLLLRDIRDNAALSDLINLLYTHLRLDYSTVDPQWIDIYKLYVHGLIGTRVIKDAVMLLKQIIRIQEQTLDANHPDRLTSQHELAAAYLASGQVREAVQLLEYIVKISEQTLDENDSNRLASQHELARAYRKNGQVREAVQLLEHVVKISEQTLDQNHPDRLTSQHELARAYRKNGQVREAVQLLKQITKIEEQTLDENHPNRLVSQESLAICQWQAGDKETAIEIMQRIVGIQKQFLDEDHPDLVRSKKQLYHFTH